MGQELAATSIFDDASAGARFSLGFIGRGENLAIRLKVA